MRTPAFSQKIHRDEYVNTTSWAKEICCASLRSAQPAGLQQLQIMKSNKFVEIRKKYSEHPEFLGIDIVDVNQPGAVDDTLLHIAARTGQIDEVVELIACGANVNQAGDMGFTALHQAAMKGRAEVVALLLKSGANRNMKNDWDQTALEVAEIGKHADVVSLLKRR